MSLDTTTTQQTAMLMHLALMEKARGLGESLPLQVTRQFWTEMLMLQRWQTYQTRAVNQLVQQGYLREYAASHGTMFYSLTTAGRVQADEVLRFAERWCFDFVPQSRSLFPPEGEG